MISQFINGMLKVIFSSGSLASCDFIETLFRLPSTSLGISIEFEDFIETGLYATILFGDKSGAKSSMSEL